MTRHCGWLADVWPFRPWAEFDAVLRELAIRRPPTPGVGGPFRSSPSAAALVRRAGYRDEVAYVMGHI